MRRAEKFIQDYTRNCSNEFEPQKAPPSVYNPWLTPDQARRAVEIAREEIYEWVEENAASFVGLADDEHPAIGDTKAFYGTKSLIYYLKQAMKDEQGRRISKEIL
jgi:hypothetical protein